MGFRKGRKDIRRAVIRPIIRNDQRPICMILRKKASQLVSQMIRAIMGGHQDYHVSTFGLSAFTRRL